MRFIKLPKRTAQVFVFRSLDLAWSAARRFRKPHVVVMGDCPEYWIASLGDAAALARAGYELAPE